MDRLGDGVHADVQQQGNIGIAEDSVLFVGLAEEPENFGAADLRVPVTVPSGIDVLGRDQIENDRKQAGVFNAFGRSVGDWMVVRAARQRS
jgi:hypothetical protein